ncbi:hypothetical protein AAKU67_000513 [Oxalobacteraceae bacterium GrIS 2.11]
MKLQHVLMGLALAVGVWLAFFTDKSPDSDVVGAVVKPGAAKNAGTAAGAAAPAVSGTASKGYSKTDRLIPILALASRDKLISVGHVGLDGKKIDSKASIFGMQSWTPPPPVDPKIANPPPPPPPTAPPLKFTFVGKKFEDGVWEVYLARGDETYITQVNGVIAGTYRVDSISKNAIVFTYLPLNQVQRLIIKG